MREHKGCPKTAPEEFPSFGSLGIFKTKGIRSILSNRLPISEASFSPPLTVGSVRSRAIENMVKSSGTVAVKIDQEEFQKSMKKPLVKVRRKSVGSKLSFLPFFLSLSLLHVSISPHSTLTCPPKWETRPWRFAPLPSTSSRPIATTRAPPPR